MALGRTLFIAPDRTTVRTAVLGSGLLSMLTTDSAKVPRLKFPWKEELIPQNSQCQGLSAFSLFLDISFSFTPPQILLRYFFIL